jgi:TRAP-type C4-dicarboxylate transport system permease small subunit
MRSVIKVLDTVLSRANIALMVLLVLTVSLQVFMRYIASSPVTFTEELSRYLLIWLGLLAASYAYRMRMHLALDLLILKMKGGQKVVLNVIIHLFILFFALTVLLYGGLKLVWLTYSLKQTSAAMGISLGVVYLALPISGVAISIYAIDFIRQELSGEAEELATTPLPEESPSE